MLIKKNRKKNSSCFTFRSALCAEADRETRNDTLFFLISSSKNENNEVEQQKKNEQQKRSLYLTLNTDAFFILKTRLNKNKKIFWSSSWLRFRHFLSKSVWKAYIPNFQRMTFGKKMNIKIYFFLSQPKE